MNMDEREGRTLSAKLLKFADRPALTLAPAGHVSLPEAEFQGMIKDLADLRKFKRETLKSKGAKCS